MFFFCDAGNSFEKEKLIWLQKQIKLPIKRVSVKKPI